MSYSTGVNIENVLLLMAVLFVGPINVSFHYDKHFWTIFDHQFKAQGQFQIVQTHETKIESNLY